MIGRKALGKKSALPQPVRDVYVWMNRNMGRLDPRPRMLPNFVVAGTQRGGTTSLFIYLLVYAVLIASYISVVFYLARQAGGAEAKRADPVAHGPGVLPSGAVAEAAKDA